ncbi:unnamed protein product, partial [Pleuronectes platessa]
PEWAPFVYNSSSTTWHVGVTGLSLTTSPITSAGAELIAPPERFKTYEEDTPLQRHYYSHASSSAGPTHMPRGGSRHGRRRYYPYQHNSLQERRINQIRNHPPLGDGGGHRDGGPLVVITVLSMAINQPILRCLAKQPPASLSELS